MPGVLWGHGNLKARAEPVFLHRQQGLSRPTATRGWAATRGIETEPLGARHALLGLRSWSCSLLIWLALRTLGAFAAAAKLGERATTNVQCFLAQRVG